jgi:hypothetical protein
LAGVQEGPWFRVLSYIISELEKLSKIGMDREKVGVTHLKAVSGIKSLKALEAYLGMTRKPKVNQLK